MGFGVRVKLDISRDVVNSLILLDRKMPSVARAAMYAAMRPIKAAAVMLAPYDSRLLKRAIGARAFVTRSKDAIIGEILIKKNRGQMVVRKGRKKAMYADPYKYAHLAELGTQPHATGKGSQVWSRRPDKNGRFGVRGAQHGGMHPGTTARSFMNRALLDNASAAQAIFEAAIEKSLNEII
jgi:hypothetical protein